LVAGFSVASFFLVIGVMHNDGSEPELVVGGLIASGVLVSGVVVRELVLRNSRERYLAERKRLDANIKTVLEHVGDTSPRKLTLEQNAAAIKRIRTKSEAAMVFAKIAQGHREVFELCAEYRRIVAKEMRNIHPNSPRLKALIQGNEYALKTHKFHILRWAEIESKSLAAAAHQATDEPAQVDYMERARRPLEVALGFYPEEVALKDSIEVLDDVLLSMRTREFLNNAGEAASMGEHERAASIYRQALEYLEAQAPTVVRRELQEKIEGELADLE
jgi:hypothetical protein